MSSTDLLLKSCFYLIRSGHVLEMGKCQEDNVEIISIFGAYLFIFSEDEKKFFSFIAKHKALILFSHSQKTYFLWWSPPFFPLHLALLFSFFLPFPEEIYSLRALGYRCSVVIFETPRKVTLVLQARLSCPVFAVSYLKVHITKTQFLSQDGRKQELLPP